jgi:D-inositol-3-phosphate glycosyltransferase
MLDRGGRLRRAAGRARLLIAPPGRRVDDWPPPPEFFDTPRGYIDFPTPGSEVERGPVQLLGWCLVPGAAVERVEVRVDFGPPQRARLGMPRPDLSAVSDDPRAPLAGFEYVADLSATTAETEMAVVSAVVLCSDGRRVDVDPVSFKLAPAAPVAEERHAAELRARSMRHLAQTRADPDAGVRLLVFTHQLVHGGASLYLYELLRRFTAGYGFECSVVALEDGPLRPELEAIGIPVHLTDGFPVRQADRYECALAELLAWAAPQGFNVAFVNTLGCFSGVEIARRLAIPSVWAIHESFGLSQFWLTAFTPGTLDPYVPARATRSLRDAAAVVFPAEATRRLYLPCADADRLITEPYGVELADVDGALAGHAREEVRRGLGIPDGAKMILCLGTIEPRKSQAMLVEAFAAIADRHPEAMLVLVGETQASWCADYVEGIREYVARAGLGARVRIEPVTPRPYPWHLASDVYACASDVESLPRSVVEAMVFERPVVSTRVFGVPELVEDGRTGFLCDLRDAADLARRLDDALSAGTDELRSVTSAAAARARSVHDPERSAARMSRLLTRLAADPAADPRRALEARSARAAVDG